MKSTLDLIKTNFKRANVLLVGNNDDHWTVIEQALQKCLPEVRPIRAATSKQALLLFDGWQQQEWEMPRLILLDLYLPTKADGWQLLQKIKTRPSSFRHIPIVMLSASDAPADILESYRLGASAYIVKPINLEDWLAHFRELRSYWWETVTLPPIQYGI